MFYLTIYTMKLKCNNKECNYEWDYNGLHEFWASCPRCLSKVKLRRTEEEKVELRKRKQNLEW